MTHQECHDHWQQFSRLSDQINFNDEQLTTLAKRYIEQNIHLLNDVLAISIENLKRLQHARTTNDIICTQARFTNEVSQKISLSAQRFLNASLGHIADYNEWLKAHCDLSTD